MAHIVDTALARRAAEGKPVRVGLVGAGFMAKGLVLQIEKVRIARAYVHETDMSSCWLFAVHRGHDRRCDRQ